MISHIDTDPFVCAAVHENDSGCVTAKTRRVAGMGVINKPDAVLIALVLISGMKGCNAGGGYQLNALDISPKLAGFTHGVMNMCGQATGWLAPIVLGVMARYPVVTAADDVIGPSPTGTAEDAIGMSREQWMSVHESAPPARWVEEMRAEWRAVFVMAAAIDICGLLIFLRFGSGDRQWWDASGKL